MRARLSTTTLAAGCAAALGAGLAAPAMAATGGEAGNEGRTAGFARLGQLNSAGVKGAVRLTLRGTTVDVRVYASGLLRNAPHAMHFHTGGAGQCPTMAADANADGILSTTEGHAAYGMVATSLTLSGDTTPASALAVDRFATTPYGYLTYHRRLTVDAATAKKIRAGNAVLVIHGIDPNNSGTYDGDARSDLDPTLPAEATAPAACGVIRAHTH
jgi:hypothetical protein